ncbi:MAG: glycine cleavage system protein GcvH [Pseudomonadota bacterium]
MVRLFTKDHEWIDFNDNIATIGITEHAVAQLGDVVFVEQPEVGANFSKGDACAVVESTKAASDVYAPLSGKIVDINSAIVADPALVNQSSDNEAWFFKIECINKSESDDFMDETAYKAFING